MALRRRLNDLLFVGLLGGLDSGFGDCDYRGQSGLEAIKGRLGERHEVHYNSFAVGGLR